MKFMIKKTSAAILSAMMICGCISVPGLAAETETSFIDQLKALDGVVSVTTIEVSEEKQQTDRFQDRLLLEFEQPIDWENPDAGTFTQRVFLGYSETADVTCYSTGGYCLMDKKVPGYFEKTDVNVDFANRYDTNLVELEYRFFAESAPEGLSIDEETYWEYMTSENASKDFHHIITELSKVLDGSTIFYGASKGGYTTESMAYYFPDDINAYVSYVAPLCEGTNDPRFYEYVFTEIGGKDPKYGEENAARYREAVLQLQLLLLNPAIRDTAQEYIMSLVEPSGRHISPLATEDEAYEVAVCDFGTTLWMYFDQIDQIEMLASMPEDTEDELFQKAEAVMGLFVSLDPVSLFAYDDFLSPYYIQSYTEMGQLTAGLSYLREAGAELRTLPEAEDDLVMRMWAPVVVNSNLEFDDSFNKELLEFMNTTDKDIIKIVGYSDPWYSVKAPETDNEHIHLYEVSGNHGTGIHAMDEETQAECYALLDSLLGK